MATTDKPPPEALPEQDEALQEVESIELPTAGRIVLIRINLSYEEEPKLRPAIVLECDEDGRALLQPFIAHSDFPLPNAAARSAEQGRFDYGEDCGQWRWPER